MSVNRKVCSSVEGRARLSSSHSVPRCNRCLSLEASTFPQGCEESSGASTWGKANGMMVIIM